MGFLDKLLDVASALWDAYQVSQVYPTLQAALHKYLDAEGYTLIESTPFTAKLEKQGAFSTKTVTLTVREDGSVYIDESGFFGEKKIFPKVAGAPTPQQFEQMLREGEGHAQLPQAEEETAIAFRALFLMFGKLSKADSRVSQEEIEAVESIMASAKLDQETRKIAIEFFNEGKETRTPFQKIAAEYAQHAEDDEMRQDALYCLIGIATASGELHATEERYLNEAVVAFGLPRSFLTEALEGTVPNLQKCYATLGCDPSVSDAELTRCYRELSKQYHPDRVSSKQLAPDFLEFAKKKFQEIQNAYETIIESRKKHA